MEGLVPIHSSPRATSTSTTTLAGILTISEWPSGNLLV